MRSPNRRRHATLAALTAGILITAGCGGDGGGQAGPQSNELYFQPVMDRGPDPFTESTAIAPPRTGTKSRAVASPQPRGGDSYNAHNENSSGRTARALPGSTPGLYSGTQANASCDVDRQLGLLTEEPAKAAAFAKGARVSRDSVTRFLHGLTPVFLRADVRMTNHAYRGGAPVEFQSVLQAGTPVLVDSHGLPRVRCTSGSPLRPPIVAQGSMIHRGTPWRGYRPERVVVIDRTTQPLSSLILVDMASREWIERLTGTRGEADGSPGVVPAYGPDADITDPDEVKTPAQPTGAAVPPAPPAGPPAPAAPPGPPGVSSGRGEPLLPPRSEPEPQSEDMPDLLPDGGSGDGPLPDPDDVRIDNLLIGPVSLQE
ncbi:DUF6777 domain-containing protein [Streptomyces sp. NPDC059396]|uniref:DUF6777 domain-containing protein n=1 Tax=Streptomyces sp. NPDC059396 TaxID=3346819 RepID=UPI003678AF30